MASPTSGEYENDKSDFESNLSPEPSDGQKETSQVHNLPKKEMVHSTTFDSGNVSPKHSNGQEEKFQEHSLSKKEITRSKTETNIGIKHVNFSAAVTDRHSIGGMLNSSTDTHVSTAKTKFSFLPKRKHSSGDYPPIPPKPTVASGGSPKSSSTSPKTSKNSTSSPIARSVSPKINNTKNPPSDPPSSKGKTTNSPTHNPKRGSYGRSHTLKKNSHDDDSRFASRCATMGTQEAFHEHHMNKQRRKKSSDKHLRRYTASTDNGNVKQVTGSSFISNKFDYQFSPDMEERLQLKIEQGIECTYGPIDKCIQAAITIQRYYRQHKMVQRFKTLRKEVISVAALQPSRPRAFSTKLPVRAHSIRLKSNQESKISILDGFPEYRNLTNRIANHSTITNHPLVESSGNKDMGPGVWWRKEASIEVQETVLQITEKSVTPVRALSVTDDAGKDEVFSPTPTPSPELVFSPSPDSDAEQEIKRPSGVPTSLSVDFLTGSHEEGQTIRPHSISIMSHITRSTSMEELLTMDEGTAKSKRQRLKPQESASSLKKKTNIGITLFNRFVNSPWQY